MSDQVPRDHLLWHHLQHRGYEAQPTENQMHYTGATLTDVQQLQLILGMINFMQPYIPHLSIHTTLV